MTHLQYLYRPSRGLEVDELKMYCKTYNIFCMFTIYNHQFVISNYLLVTKPSHDESRLFMFSSQTEIHLFSTLQ